METVLVLEKTDNMLIVIKMYILACGVAISGTVLLLLILFCLRFPRLKTCLKTNNKVERIISTLKAIAIVLMSAGLLLWLIASQVLHAYIGSMGPVGLVVIMEVIALILVIFCGRDLIIRKKSGSD